MEKYVRITLAHRFRIIPGRGTNKAVICSLVSPIKEGASEAVFQTAERFDARHDIGHGDPLAEVFKETIVEGFKADRRKHDLDVQASRERQDVRKVRGMSVDVIDPADEINL
jgi:hypothetical protein